MSAAEEYRKRIAQSIITVLQVCIVLILYTFFFTFTGKGIPCIFHELTGMLCPGCGMSHALSSIVQGNFSEALEYNALSLTVCPCILIFLILRSIKYIKTGKEEFSAAELIFLVCCLLICIWYFLYRNNFI